MHSKTSIYQELDKYLYPNVNLYDLLMILSNICVALYFTKELEH